MIEYLVPLGIFLIFLGVIIVFAGTFMQPKADAKSHVAVGGFIGPFGFANSNLALYIMIGLMALTIIVWFLVNKYY
jgi:uncharacterized membrane protein